MSTWALKGANYYIVLLDLRPVILIHEIFHCCNDQKITFLTSQFQALFNSYQRGL